uniref:noggin-2-like isoform X2 n=1 Tax=Myxine glutinosa TaxID=7769 RepID=UPI00358FF52F
MVTHTYGGHLVGTGRKRPSPPPHPCNPVLSTTNCAENKKTSFCSESSQQWPGRSRETERRTHSRPDELVERPMEFWRRLSAVCSVLLLLALRPERIHCRPPQVRLRPSPSDELPLLSLKEDPDPRLDPTATDLDEHVLRSNLGSAFDPKFMAIGRPDVPPSREPRPPKPQGSLARELRRHLDSPGDGTHQIPKLKVGQRARRKLLRWLWANTHCPVAYTWKDLGVRFWPRFLKEGNCSSGRSCSFPEGMTCKQAKSVNKTLLRWHCQGWDPQHYCTWIRIQYPVISECKCSC